MSSNDNPAHSFSPEQATPVGIAHRDEVSAAAARDAYRPHTDTKITPLDGGERAPVPGASTDANGITFSPHVPTPERNEGHARNSDTPTLPATEAPPTLPASEKPPTERQSAAETPRASFWDNIKAGAQQELNGIVSSWIPRN